MSLMQLYVFKCSGQFCQDWLSVDDHQRSQKEKALEI